MKATEIVGAASRYLSRRLTGTRSSSAGSAGWQEQAWSYYSDGDTPEVGFASTWIGNAMRQATLYAGRRQADGSIEPVEANHPAADLVAQIAGGPAGQAELLAEFGPHLVVAGEGWLLIRDNGADWRVLSVLELSHRGGRLEAMVDEEKVVVPGEGSDDPEAPVAIRVWDPHPRKHMEADSPVRRSLGLLNELRLLNASVAAIARSQLTGRGVMTFPQGTRFPTAPGTNAAEDDLIEVFMQVAETAYKDPESAAAAVPIILELPDSAQKPERITFESAFDELAIRLRDEAIRRFAAGLDTPAEILLGMAATNHWTAWALQGEAVTLAVEPRLGLVCDALTTQWLRPLLGDIEDVEDLVVWYDSSPLRVRANRPQTALEVFQTGAIGQDALRRETGFDDADAPTEQERERELLIRLVTQAPSLAPIILPALGISIAGLVTDTEVTETTSTPDPGAGEGTELPVDESPRPPEEPTGEPAPELTNA